MEIHDARDTKDTKDVRDTEDAKDTNETNKDADALPERMFFTGQTSYIVVGNSCRMLDERRTPGFIEEYFPEIAMFRWRITDFENKGSYLDVAAEDINQFQMLIGSQELESDEIATIERRIRELDKGERSRQP